MEKKNEILEAISKRSLNKLGKVKDTTLLLLSDEDVREVLNTLKRVLAELKQDVGEADKKIEVLENECKIVSEKLEELYHDRENEHLELLATALDELEAKQTEKEELECKKKVLLEKMSEKENHGKLMLTLQTEIRNLEDELYKVGKARQEMLDNVQNMDMHFAKGTENANGNQLDDLVEFGKRTRAEIQALKLKQKSNINNDHNHDREDEENEKSLQMSSLLEPFKNIFI
uniref:Uncharacterized protein n=1 Tax=Aplanochytrium stocchinoi TaxID=215587 RepID=A0A7S3PPP4_9STRA|mmetsp:Transcript_10899/g.12492  ORF Transcript_10899/g.12492 Transcript_10899/m.12492 type:complete len:231 (+) Transcript_10899:226-918(+)